MWLFFCLTINIVFWGLIFSSREGNRLDFRYKSYLFLMFGTFTLLAAFRSERVGNDTYIYKELFKSVSITNDLAIFSPRFEIGYIYLNKLISFVTNNSQAIIIVTSLFVLLGYARFIYKYSKSYWLSTFLFFTLGYYGMSMNTIRLNIAIVLLLFSYDYIKRKKILRFILIIIFATLFHRTAIVFLIAWFIPKLRFNTKLIILLGSITLFATLGFSYLLELVLTVLPMYDYYLESLYLDGQLRIASVINFLIMLCILVFGVIILFNDNFFKDKEIKIAQTSELKDQHNFLIFLLVGICVICVSFNFNLLDRVGDYFTVFSIILLPNVIVNIKNIYIKGAVTIGITLLFFLYALLIQIYRPEWNVIYPYTFFW